jgi:hypothetical protein
MPRHMPASDASYHIMCVDRRRSSALIYWFPQLRWSLCRWLGANGYQMALKIEGIVDSGMHAEEALSGSS